MKTSLTTLALVAMTSVPAVAATVTNGSFENIDQSQLNENGWALFDSIDGWAPLDGTQIEIQSDPTLGVIDAQDGNHYAELHSDGLSTLSQTVTLGTGLHEFSFFYSPRSGRVGNNDMAYSISGLFDGLVVGAPSGDFARGSWTEIGQSFNVETAGDYVLTFTALDGPNNRVGALIDNISISAVPVPAAGLMLLTAVGGAAAMRRKKA